MAGVTERGGRRCQGAAWPDMCLVSHSKRLERFPEAGSHWGSLRRGSGTIDSSGFKPTLPGALWEAYGEATAQWPVCVARALVTCARLAAVRRRSR